ncbi:MAG: ADP-ribosylglycohydrolase family protein [Ruminococcaceae bacterium]|nr:ADP-ribosylglycohydrolase family protein [Oscillospiraceae bacterium]
MKNTRIKLNLEDYKDRVYACFLGKNIGGTMGGPYECTHDILDIKGFSTAPGAPLPNDDLDLQLVWLHAVEKLGINAINAATLGEFWLSFITPHWNEYGIGKVNMKRGLLPPLAGDYENTWRDSNGAWIRTEVWACLTPGCPNVAAKLATEDAKVDHGSGEGTYAAAFVAGMQAAAFVCSDLRDCIRIGLAEIPADCRMADSVRLALDCYDRGVPPMEARNIIQQRNADIGTGWFEAPSNVAYAVLGLLYGEGDFKKSMIIAINCGDDTDCTAATVGATMGILGGTAVIPADWQTHIGDDIVTISINRGDICRHVPYTCTELCERIAKQAPHALFAENVDVSLTDGADEIPTDISEKLLAECNSHIAEVTPYSVHYDYTFMSADVALDDAPDIAPCETRKVMLKFTNNWRVFDKCQYNLTLRWWLPEGFSAEGGKQCITLPRMDPHYPDACCAVEFTLRAGETVAAVNRCVLEVVAEGRITPMYIPIVLLG